VHFLQQGDNVKRVEFHVVKAGGCTDLGNTKLQKAKRLKKKQRKVRGTRLKVSTAIEVRSWLSRS
jgi:hypothetical protein